MSLEITTINMLAKSAWAELWKQLKKRREERVAAEYQTLLNHIFVEMALRNPEAENIGAESSAEMLSTASLEAQDLLIEAFETMVRSLCPEAKPYIARLAAWYMIEGRPVDMFYRRMGRVLLDAEPADLSGLQLLARLIRRTADMERDEYKPAIDAGINAELGTDVALVAKRAEQLLEADCREPIQVRDDGIGGVFVGFEHGSVRRGAEILGEACPWSSLDATVRLLSIARLAREGVGNWNGGKQHLLSVSTWRDLALIFDERALAVPTGEA